MPIYFYFDEFGELDAGNHHIITYFKPNVCWFCTANITKVGRI
ncbi:hypothetical protein AO378_1368 [Moraxella catarrhalis]|nr:hypothetical protein AO378_1368 [Moraxella catarrhalis]